MVIRGLPVVPNPRSIKTHMPEMCPTCGASDLEVTDIKLKDMAADISSQSKGGNHAAHYKHMPHALTAGHSGIELEVQTHENSEDPHQLPDHVQ